MYIHLDATARSGVALEPALDSAGSKNPLAGARRQEIFNRHRLPNPSLAHPLRLINPIL